MNGWIVARIRESVQRHGRHPRRPDTGLAAAEGLSAAFLLRRGLVALDCPPDGHRHLIDDQHHAHSLTFDAEPRLVTVCGLWLTPPSLHAEPRPLCPACAAVLRTGPTRTDR